MDFLKSTAASYVGMVLAVAAIVAGVFFPDYSGVVWTLAGVFGFGSVAALRSHIDSQGWKTYGAFIVVLALTALQIFGILTPENVHALFVVLGPVVGITVQQALAKSPTSTVKRATG